MPQGKVIIVGGSGFIGTALSEHLKQNNWDVIVVDQNEPRTKGVQFIEADLMEKLPRSQILERPRAIINLSGKSVSGRWTKERKQQIYDSRITSTRNIIKLFEDIAYRPEVFINASAVGIYGNRGSEELIEISPIGEGFLSRVSKDWEEEAKKAERFGMRVVLMRQGIVIGKEGGYLKSLRPFLKLKILPRIGNGENWFSWIHSKDLVRIYEAIILNPDLRGPINVVAPEPLQTQDLNSLIAHKFGVRFAPMVPEWLAELLLSGLEREIAYSQRVLPQILARHNFEWRYPQFKPALAHEAN